MNPNMTHRTVSIGFQELYDREFDLEVQRQLNLKKKE